METKNRSASKIWLGVAMSAFVLSLVGLFWEGFFHSPDRIELQALNPISKVSHDSNSEESFNNDDAEQRVASADALPKTSNSQQKNKSNNQNELQQDSSPDQLKNLLSSPDEDMWKTIVSLAGSESSLELTPESLQDILKSQGIETNLRQSGNEQTGERVELEGTMPQRGLQAVRASFERSDSGKEELTRLQFKIADGENNYKNLVTKISQNLGEQNKPTLVTTTSSRWMMGDFFSVAVKHFEKTNPHPELKNSLVQVTLEYEVE